MATARDERWSEVFASPAMRDLCRISDLRAWGSIAVNWGLIAASLALVAAWPHPLTIVSALFVLGGRQLGLAVLMHEAAHRTLLRSRRANDWVGNWLCAYPIWSDLRPYRSYHLQHHARTWTAEDPDLSLASPFPITRASLSRKIVRDLTGQTGWKRFRAALRRDLGASSRRNFDAGLGSLPRVALTNAVLLGVLTLLGHPALYLLWVGAWLTTYSLVMRIRSIAEHGMVTDPADPLQNTRTTRARWWERLFIAPNRVNYHLEHHLLMAVPHYHLPRMHHLLRARDLLNAACVSDGYLAVLRLASSRAAS